MSPERFGSSWFRRVVRGVTQFVVTRGLPRTPTPDWAPLFMQGEFADWVPCVPAAAARRSLPFVVGERWIEEDGGRARRPCGGWQEIDLTGLLRSCNELAPRAWPDAIDAHFTRILTQAHEVVVSRRPDVSRADGAALMLPVAHEATYAVYEMLFPSRTPTPWSSWHLGLELGGRDYVPDAELLSSWGLSVDAAFEMALANLGSRTHLERADERFDCPEIAVLRGPTGAEARVLLAAEGLDPAAPLGYLIGFPVRGTVVELRIGGVELPKAVHSMLVGMVQLREVRVGEQVFRVPAQFEGTLWWWQRGKLRGQLFAGRNEAGQRVCIPTEALRTQVFDALQLGRELVYPCSEDCPCAEFSDRTFVAESS